MRRPAVGGFGASDLVALTLGLAFIYAPIVLVVLYSFNESRLVTVWGGFSTRWYEALPGNAPLLEALGASLRVAAASATLATLVGTAAALVLARHGRFAGRRLFATAILAPLIMPDVVIGLSLLLLAIALGFGRGLWAVAIAHAVLSTAYVAVVVQARAASLDRDLEEAAVDLGATPVAAFLSVTLPLLAPAIASGFLIAFTISLDDVVLASFLGGPGATTLPMRLYSQVRLGVTPEVNAVSSLLIGFVAILLAVSGRLLRPRAAGAGRRLSAGPPEP